MKHAYVSLVFHGSSPSLGQFERIDGILHRLTRLHEVIVVVPHGSHKEPYGQARCSGPITVVSTRDEGPTSAAFSEGLGRAVGDFVIEWRGSPDDLNEELIERMLSPTNDGFEIIELIGKSHPLADGALADVLVNRLRVARNPIRSGAVGRVFSRSALNNALLAASYESDIDVVIADLPLSRKELQTDSALKDKPPGRRFSETANLLLRNTRVGSAAAVIFAAFFGGLFLGVAAYGLYTQLILRDSAPEWVTEVAILGLGQSAILLTLSLIWSRLDAAWVSRPRGRASTSEVTVWAPNVSADRATVFEQKKVIDSSQP